MADSSFANAGGNLSGEVAVLKAQLNLLRAQHPDIDVSGLSGAVDNIANRHTQLVNEAHNAAVNTGQNIGGSAPDASTVPTSTSGVVQHSPLGPFSHPKDRPSVLAFGTPENTPRITPQNVSIPARVDDPVPYPYPNPNAQLPTADEQSPSHNTIVTTAPNTVPEAEPTPARVP